MVQYITIFIISILSGFGFGDYVIAKKAKRFHRRGYIRGFHIHHSVYGVTVFFFLPLTLHNFIETVFLSGFGLGIIIEHTFHEGFKFITREMRKVNKEVNGEKV